MQARTADRELTFEPPFFTPAEVALTLDRVEQRHLNQPWSPSRYLVPLALVNLVRSLRETLDEIVTLSRIAGMIEEFRSDGQECFESDQEHLRALVPHLQAAVRHLRSEPTPSRNRVVWMLYLQELLAVLDDPQALSPRWRKLAARIERSRLLRRAFPGEMG